FTKGGGSRFPKEKVASASLCPWDEGANCQYGRLYKNRKRIYIALASSTIQLQPVALIRFELTPITHGNKHLRGFCAPLRIFPAPVRKLQDVFSGFWNFPKLPRVIAISADTECQRLCGLRSD